jgi:hypothetical protein
MHADYGRYPSLDSIRVSANYTTSRGVTMTAYTRGGVGLDAVARMEGVPGFCRLLIGDVAPAWLYRFPWCDPGARR